MEETDVKAETDQITPEVPIALPDPSARLSTAALWRWGC
jgi:hypothetical protein